MLLVTTVALPVGFKNAWVLLTVFVVVAPGGVVIKQGVYHGNSSVVLTKPASFSAGVAVVEQAAVYENFRLINLYFFTSDEGGKVWSRAREGGATGAREEGWLFHEICVTKLGVFNLFSLFLTVIQEKGGVGGGGVKYPHHTLNILIIFFVENFGLIFEELKRTNAVCVFGARTFGHRCLFVCSI